MTTSNTFGAPVTGEDLDVALARARLEVARERTLHNLVEVQTGLAKTIDWRDWIREHPDLAMVSAFLVGFIAGHRR